ncbi:MAG: hypothetical protein KatS3mg022_3591 [Armatimonadota bacterium]|nr:MAG: hypothetical protein KatS3mg022_3591 [Armatimonadota bacterium]
MRLEGNPVEVLQAILLAGQPSGYWVSHIARTIGGEVEVVEQIDDDGDRISHYCIHFLGDKVDTWEFRRDPEVLNKVCMWIEYTDTKQLKEVARLLAMATSCTISYVDDEHIIVDNFSPVYTL